MLHIGKKKKKKNTKKTKNMYLNRKNFNYLIIWYVKKKIDGNEEFFAPTLSNLWTFFLVDYYQISELFVDHYQINSPTRD